MARSQAARTHSCTGRSPWHRRALLPAALSLVAVLTVTGVTPAPAAPSPRDDAPRAAAGAAPQLLLRFGTGDRAVLGRTVRNATGPGGGTVVVADGGRLRARPGNPGRAAQFPCGGCGRAIIEVPDRKGLDPRNDSFRFGADVRMTPRQANRRTNVVQKDYYRHVGGQYKLQVDHGVPNCVISGSAGRVMAQTSVSVADRAWHRVVCIREAGSVVLRIDGVVRGRSSGTTGHIASSSPVRVGGKNVKDVTNDQYRGRLDNVLVKIRRR